MEEIKNTIEFQSPYHIRTEISTQTRVSENGEWRRTNLDLCSPCLESK